MITSMIILVLSENVSGALRSWCTYTWRKTRRLRAKPTLLSLLGALGFKCDGKAPSQNPADDTEKNRLGERTIGAILYLVGQTYSEY